MRGLQLLQLILGVLACLRIYVKAEDPYKLFTWTVTYGNLAPLGVSQQVILINGQFPGPRLDVVTNDNMIINVINKLDEPFLITCNPKRIKKSLIQVSRLCVKRKIEDYIVRLVVCRVISWTTLFISVRNMFQNISFGFCNRIVSTIHASLCVILASLSFQDWNCPVCPMASSSSPFQMQTLAVTLAYMIYDLMCCFFGPGHFNIDTVVRHLVSIIGIGAGLSYQMVLVQNFQFWTRSVLVP